MLHVCNSISSRHMYHRLSSILFATIDFSRMTLSGGKVAAGGSQVMTAGVPIVNGGDGPRRISNNARSDIVRNCAATDQDDFDTNPLLRSWSDLPFNIPPFAEIEPEHFKPAFEFAMEKHLQELRDIVENPDKPTFENVMAAYDRSGYILNKVSSVFSALRGSANIDAIKELSVEMSPILSRHRSKTYHMEGLFEKINEIYKFRNTSDLSSEQIRLVEVVHDKFLREGANFDENQKKEYSELLAELASLHVAFSQNVLVDEESFEMVLQKSDFSGCPESLIDAANKVAIERGKASDEYVLTLSRTFVEPFLTFSNRRDLRKFLFEKWISRGQLSQEGDNVHLAEKILKLRQKQAAFFGFDNYAEWKLTDRMAKTPMNVSKLLDDVWSRAKLVAEKEREEMEKFVSDSGEILDGGIQPWDWRYYARKTYSGSDVSEQLKPYLSLDTVFDMATYTSSKLFGLKYVERSDITSYHSDVRTYEVREETENSQDRIVSIFMKDDFARRCKSSGAWMSELRSQKNNLASTDLIEGLPIVMNNNNFAKANPTLLSFDEATTLFHELGHGHHGMLSDSTFETLSSTNVATDFVELQSQLFENWLSQPEVLKRAKHYETGEPIPESLLEGYKKSLLLHQGFQTVEYTACAIFDMAIHQLTDYTDFNLLEFERMILDKIGMPQGIVFRHRPPSFSHLFSGSMYAAGYYSYIWADVLAADAFGAFTESGDVFDTKVASDARKFIYSSGNTFPSDELFRKFRGRDPDIEFLLKKRGLV